jgi:transaldolase/glucose-6-phosphate isomerase
VDTMPDIEKPEPTAERALARQQISLGGLDAALRSELERWQSERLVARLWSRDAALWTGGDEARWLGWLGALDAWREQRPALRSLVESARSGRFSSVVVLGMGGSSLFPDVLGQTFARPDGYPKLHVADSTVPAEIRTLESRIELDRTLFVASSKSGSTIETAVLKEHFFAQLRTRLGEREAGARFVAITDPGSALEADARREQFLAILPGVPSIGGRFSALSNFGLAPAAAAGLDVDELVARARAMAAACRSENPVENPGVLLGLALGVCAQHGIDKLTIVAPPPIASLPAWLEQLVAESTGKHGRGILPVVDEALGPPERYGDDRLFVQLRLDGEDSAEQDRAIEALAARGRPVVRIDLGGRADIAQEVFRWEIATAVAGAVLGVHPFDQPDVEAAKVAARELTSAFEKQGALPEPTPAAAGDGLSCYAVPGAPEGTPDERIAALLASLRPGDYFAITAFLERDAANTAALQAIRHAVRDAKRVATTLGFGPRFLHSTGQLHKGGPNRGVFLQLTCDDGEIAIPGRRFGFAVLNRAQALGDFRVLAERGRRLLRVHVGIDIEEGLLKLARSIERALGASSRA